MFFDEYYHDMLNMMGWGSNIWISLILGGAFFFIIVIILFYLLKRASPSDQKEVQVQKETSQRIVINDELEKTRVNALFCPNCGEKLKKGIIKYCPACGTEI